MNDKHFSRCSRINCNFFKPAITTLQTQNTPTVNSTGHSSVDLLRCTLFLTICQH